MFLFWALRFQFFLHFVKGRISFWMLDLCKFLLWIIFTYNLLTTELPSFIDITESWLSKSHDSSCNIACSADNLSICSNQNSCRSCIALLSNSFSFFQKISIYKIFFSINNPPKKQISASIFNFFFCNFF